MPVLENYKCYRCKEWGVMQRSVLSDVATMGTSLENIVEFDVYCEAIELTQDTLERVSDL